MLDFNFHGRAHCLCLGCHVYSFHDDHPGSHRLDGRHDGLLDNYHDVLGIEVHIRCYTSHLVQK